MTSSILFCGSEDLSFTSTGATIGTSGNLTVDTTAGRFRSGYARYAITVTSTSSTPSSIIVYSTNFGAQTSFWFSGRVWNNVAGGSTGQPTSYPLDFFDTTGVKRIRLKNNASTTNSLQGTNWSIEKVSAANVETSLATFASSVGFTQAPAGADKLDIQMSYGTSGFINVYINNVLVMATGTVDTTTDGNTSLAQVGFSSLGAVTGGGSTITSWSEIIVATQDTRALSLVTQAATASGNTDTWTSGSASNINANQYKDTSPDYSTTANQIQEYQVTPALPAGTFAVLSVVQHARVLAQTGGPQNFQFMVRTSSTDYTSSTQGAPTGAFGLLTNNWDTNPNSGGQWAPTDLAASSTSFNFGFKSIT